MIDAGKAAEALAAAYLQQRGLQLLERNYLCRFGEIDLIMRDGSELVFVEVRLRTNAKFGGAGASITSSKQQKLARTAQHYLMQHGDAPCRFDAVLLGSLDATDLQWLKNAIDTSWT